MTVIRPITDVYSSNARALRRGVEKPNVSSGLKDERKLRQQPKMLNMSLNDRRRSSRFETRADPPSNEGGMPAGFIAQVLGQVLTTNDAEKARRARAAREYARSGRAQRAVTFIRWV
jgi:hypothetical protein